MYSGKMKLMKQRRQAQNIFFITQSDVLYIETAIFSAIGKAGYWPL